MRTLLALAVVGLANAAPVAIPDTPFVIECPEGFTVRRGNWTTNREGDPNKGIDGATGHIHVYRRMVSSPDEAIAKTEAGYRDLEAKQKRPRPSLSKVEDFTTQTGIAGRMAFFVTHPGASKIKEKKFYFTADDGAVWCACLEIHTAAGWQELERILTESLRPAGQE